MKYIDEFRNPKAAIELSKNIRGLAGELFRKNRSVNIMEVCGSHTMAIGKYGIRDILDENIDLISGPGCPVCVTSGEYINTAIELARRGVVIATFGDMINVPGSKTSLSKIRSEGCPVEICYSPQNAINFALKNPDKEIVFLAIGFETTMVPCIALLDMIIKKKISNLSLLTAFKLVPPALEALVEDDEINIDAFLCPAHVSAVIGARQYRGFVEKYRIPCVIASFEPLDILLGLQCILEQLVNNEYKLENKYKRVVKEEGNVKAQRLIARYVEEEDASWRGIGVIPRSGMTLKPEYKEFDAGCKYDVTIKKEQVNTNCRCGDVLKGKVKPNECRMFAVACDPLNPIGPCMVSSEGSCAAYYKYRNTS